MVFAATAGLLIAALVALGVGWRPPVAVAAVLGAVVAAGFVAWVVLGFRATSQMAREREAGYATAADVAGLELRDPRTGRLLRARDIAPAEVGADPRPLVARLLSIPAGSMLDRTTKDETPRDS